MTEKSGYWVDIDTARSGCTVPAPPKSLVRSMRLWRITAHGVLWVGVSNIYLTMKNLGEQMEKQIDI